MVANMAIIAILLYKTYKSYKSYITSILNPTVFLLLLASIPSIIQALASTPPYEADVRFSVSMPQTDTDVVYDIKLASISTPGDTLAPCDYLIDWTLGETSGFTSYFGGNLYRFRDSRLAEYHTSWDAAPFEAARAGGGVQRAAQFTGLLPQFIAGELAAMQDDPRYTIAVAEKVFGGAPAVEVSSRMEVGGAVVQEKTYLLDPETSLPLRVVTESNPASITEQTIVTDYTTLAGADPLPRTEEALIARYPEVFENFRESNFSIENLPGRPLPAFALPTLTGERYIHDLGAPFKSPTVVALIDPAGDAAFNRLMVESLREAVALSPIPADLILAFAGSDIDTAESIAGRLLPGETHLLRARSLARDCGVASLPVVIVAAPDATVTKVLLGFNKNISQSVIQAIALAGQK